MSERKGASLVLGMISIVALCAAVLLGATSCAGESAAEEQDILLSFPELSSMTVGQTHPFVVDLNLPAVGTETLAAAVDSDRVQLWPASYLLDKNDTTKTFSITAKATGKVIVRFSLGQLLSKTLPIREIGRAHV